MDEPAPPAKRPSLFIGGIVGYLVASFVGAIVCWIVCAQAGDFDNQRAFAFLVCFGAPGAFAVYERSVRRRKKLAVNEPTDEWQQFFGSWTFNFLAGIVLAGSFAVSLVESLIFDLVYGAPWLENL